MPAGPPPDVVQVLVPGSTYNRAYWEFPIERASYVAGQTRRGQAVFAFDRLNTGRSSSVVPAAALTIETDAAVVHQIATALRSGGIGPTRFPKVVIVGHSLGSLISVEEAATYQDVDGVVLTGFSHTPNLAFLGQLALGKVFLPASLSGGSSPNVQGQPLDELSTPVGAREKFFYDPSTTDPTIVAADEATKDIITAGELVNFPVPVYGPRTQLIDAPVLVANGSRDQVFYCGLGTCTDERTLRSAEEPYFPAAPSFDAFVLPGSGHDINLATNADGYYAAVASWVDSRVSRR
jgi:pimeloyl-ACP methyl ester carboxylesterase